MIRKLLCWLGLHNWVKRTLILPNGISSSYTQKMVICKHCWKVKNK